MWLGALDDVPMVRAVAANQWLPSYVVALTTLPGRPVTGAAGGESRQKKTLWY
jgi:hypothetical protein